jgi:hypothetical protein
LRETFTVHHAVEEELFEDSSDLGSVELVNKNNNLHFGEL